jgi:pimeloyl-ACP methyl ester carboxylesterase
MYPDIEPYDHGLLDVGDGLLGARGLAGRGRSRAGGGKLAGIPGVLIHGRLDISGPPDIAWRMAQAWPGAELHLVEQEGHGAGGRRTTELILAALDHFALRS